eukprot:1193280-Prorocentrum_minimum.AAC.1
MDLSATQKRGDILNAVQSDEVTVCGNMTYSNDTIKHNSRYRDVIQISDEGRVNIDWGYFNAVRTVPYGGSALRRSAPVVGPDKVPTVSYRLSAPHCAALNCADCTVLTVMHWLYCTDWTAAGGSGRRSAPHRTALH